MFLVKHSIRERLSMLSVALELLNEYKPDI